FPSPSAPEKKPDPAARRPADPLLASDQVEVPVSKTPPPADAARPKPAEPPANPAPSLRVLFKAWAAAQNDFITGYKDKKQSTAKYEEIVESLRLMKAQVGDERAPKLQIYIDYYAAINEKTRGFSALPEKTTEKDILDELEVAARVIRKEF